MAALEYGQVDGFGRFGILEETPQGLRCAQCGAVFEHLGLHVARAHGVTAAQYRLAHGLKRSRGLVCAGIRVKQVENGKRIAASASGAALAAARDPHRATQIRHELRRPVSAQAARERDQRAFVMGRSARKGRVIRCGWCGCLFCPLAGAARRQYCSRSCASTANRRRARSRPAGAERDRGEP